MHHKRNHYGDRAGRLVRPAFVCAALLLAPLATTAPAVAQPAAVQPSNASLFFGPSSGQAANELVALLASARADGLDPKRYRPNDLARLIRAAWGGRPQALARADQALTDAYVRYAQDLGRAPDVGTIYVDAELKPAPPKPETLIDQAKRAPDLETYFRTMGWVHPYYVQLRRQLISGSLDARQRAIVQLNMQRVRSLPATGRYVLVNAAAQRLFMMEGSQPVDMMRVVVGKPIYPTPMMAALIRFASLRPYWNVPTDLAAERVAPSVVKEGLTYLRQKGYQVLSDWSDNPKLVNPATIDWKAVADGRQQVRLRQLPGPSNSMGDVKFMFPNAQGIYLHDTPQNELFAEAARLFSGGCVRLEAASRLGTWLFGKPLKAKGSAPEQKVPLPSPVPVYITYLTAVPSGSDVAFYDDIYNRDGLNTGKQRLAAR